ncbi:hypothetical protein HPP92_002578 [Vanilla planifolia]|uniref:Uncharacterized protein n=1 Tax=Vanilla planifolia TaxID=51239 RepID=A0A835S222_VANPL|nr:hypothetical protein HPP92_002578 [Vanilla planifolia]
MGPLQRLKAFAFPCGAAGDASACFRIRRRKAQKITFLMRPPSPRQILAVEKKELLGTGRSLKDFLTSSPPPNTSDSDGSSWKRFALDRMGDPARCSRRGSRQFVLAGRRYWMLSKSWRPALVSIPETRTEDDERLTRH